MRKPQKDTPPRIERIGVGGDYLTIFDLVLQGRRERIANLLCDWD
jgi:hypothetical protein